MAKSDHKLWIHKVMSDEEYQEEWEASKQVMPNGAVIEHPDKYKPEFDDIAFKIMSQADAANCHLCVAIKCSDMTLRSWLKRHPSFREAYVAGKAIGEEKFRKKIESHAFKPSAHVNNGLIKLLAKNVHGIDADEPAVIINNNQSIVSADKETARMFADALGRDIEDE